MIIMTIFLIMIITIIMSMTIIIIPMIIIIIPACLQPGCFNAIIIKSKLLEAGC